MRIGLFGLPGAGKGTQALLLAKHLKIPHVSTGDMFRALESGNSPIAKEIKGILASGKLVSDDLVTQLVFERLKEPDCKNGFILDGYPRTLPQAKDLQSSVFSLDALICLDVEKREIIRRLSDRRVCPQCKSVFRASILIKTSASGSTCPNDGSLVEQRTDDTAEAVTIRLDIFESNFLPVVGFFQELGLLHRVDGNGSLDQVFSRLSALITDMFDGPK